MPRGKVPAHTLAAMVMHVLARPQRRGLTGSGGGRLDRGRVGLGGLVDRRERVRARRRAAGEVAESSRSSWFILFVFLWRWLVAASSWICSCAVHLASGLAMWYSLGRVVTSGSSGASGAIGLVGPGG